MNENHEVPKPFICVHCGHPLMTDNERHATMPVTPDHCIFCALDSCTECKRKREAYKW